MPTSVAVATARQARRLDSLRVAIQRLARQRYALERATLEAALHRADDVADLDDAIDAMRAAWREPEGLFRRQWAAAFRDLFRERATTIGRTGLPIVDDIGRVAPVPPLPLSLRRQLDAQAEAMAAAVGRTSARRLSLVADDLRAATRDGATNAALDAILDDAGFAPRDQRYRAVLAGAAEAPTVLGTAQYERAEQLGVAQEKRWQVTRDERVRETHRKAGEEGWIPFFARFSNGLRYPGDPEGPIGERIRCRCALLLRVGKEEAVRGEETLGELLGRARPVRPITGTTRQQFPVVEGQPALPPVAAPTTQTVPEALAMTNQQVSEIPMRYAGATFNHLDSRTLLDTVPSSGRLETPMPDAIALGITDEQAKVLHEAERRMATLPEEKLLAVRADGLYDFNFGEKASVDVTPDQQQRWPNGAVTTMMHNHPSASMFSPNDIATGFWNGVSSQRVVASFDGVPIVYELTGLPTNETAQAAALQGAYPQFLRGGWELTPTARVLTPGGARAATLTEQLAHRFASAFVVELNASHGVFGDVAETLTREGYSDRQVQFLTQLEHAKFAIGRWAEKLGFQFRVHTPGGWPGAVRAAEVARETLTRYGAIP